LSPVRTLFFFVCGFLILSAAHEAALLRVLGNRVLTFLGQISYSVYLWHAPVLAAAGATVFDHRFGRSVAAVLLTLAVATASFFFVEQPLRRRWRHPRAATEERAPEGARRL
jgi:peptidoglycan/LPS O-acetylase OafA/YrhL